MDNKIIITIGISGSGKSTWAESYVKTAETPTVIVSRDNLRMSLFGLNPKTYNEYFAHPDLRKREDKITKFHDEQIWYALRNGFDVVADNTHLRESYIYAYKMFGVKLQVHAIDVNTQTAICRDFDRDRTVGYGVIERQQEMAKSLFDKLPRIIKELEEYNKEIEVIYDKASKRPYDPAKKSVVIFDIDGTLADNKDRSPFDFSRISEDALKDHIAYINHAIASHDGDTYVTTIVCSGREEVCREDTVKWLAKHKIHFSELHMRKKGDNRKDWLVKTEIWRDIQDRYNIMMLIDDRDQVVHIARRLGYPTIQVSYGGF